MPKEPTRRNFLKTSTAAATTAAVASQVARSAHAQGSDEIRVVLIGCGGRGTGAATNIMNTKGNVKLVAVADAFPKKAADCVKVLSRKYKEKIDVPQDRMFIGLDAFKAAIDVDSDLVVVATPPAFKPQQFEYAVSRGRHVFSEKPVASDVAGVKRFMAAVQDAKKKNLLIGIGLQRRHENQYKETIQRIHDGAIGDVLALRVYWNGGGIWWRGRDAAAGLLAKPAGLPTGMNVEPTEMAFQCNNWYHFNWLSGDQICEQHIHNLDVGCWVKGEYPVECNGMGGRGQRLDGDATKSQIFDHTFCEYTFADGTKMFSQGRHLAGGFNHVAEYAQGSKGASILGAPGRDVKKWSISGENTWQFSGQTQQGHQQEQHDLIETLMKGDIYNEGEYGAKSTFTAILGREACYSGKVLKWDDLWEKGKDLAPGIDEYTLDTDPPTMPDENGEYPVPKPGQHSPFA